MFLANDDVARACLRALSVLICRDGRCLCEVPGPGSVLDLAGNAVIVVDASRRVVYFNQRASELTGYRSDEVLGLTCTEALHCTNCSTGCSLFVEGGICNRRLEIETRDGTRAIVVKDGKVLRDPEGRIVGGVETLQDVTGLAERTSADQDRDIRLQDRCRMFEAFAKDLEDGLALLDGDGRVLCLSIRAAQLLGVDPEEAHGALLSTLVETLPDLQRTLDAVRSSGQSANLEGALARSPLSRHMGTLALRLMPLAADEDVPAGTALVLRRETAPGVQESFFGILGESPAIRSVIRAVQALASKDVTVLLTGESGSGKEVVARALHLAGPRATRPFHAFNCASLSEDLLESELFGHERGAFTGAVRDKPGRLELSADGTLLLDEVGCLPSRVQAKLLRVLETREFERVGGTRTLRLRARILAATNSDLAAMVAAGTFREDLYYRLRVVPLRLPALRERRQDVMALAGHFVRSHAPADGAGGEGTRFTAAAVVALENFDWPGNIRELRNAVQFAMAMGDGRTIDVSDLPPEIRDRRPLPPADHPERVAIEDALRRSHYDRAEAARLLGISRTTLWRRMRRFGLGQ